MHAIWILAGATATLAIIASASHSYAEETKQLALPNVTVTALSSGRGPKPSAS